MKILIVGDCHGFGGMISAAHLAVDLKADAIIALGDVWDTDLSIAGEDGKSAGPPFHFVLGNHERWDRLAANKIGDGLVLHLDYTKFELGGVKFGVIGRIDDTPRVRELMEKGLWLGDPTKIFFERLEGQQIRDLLGGIDVLLTHDAPWPFVLGHRPVPTTPGYVGVAKVMKMPDSEIIGSEYLNEVIRMLQPKLHFGGHMHLLDIRYIGPTRSYNLPPIDPDFLHRGYVLLDTETLKEQYFDL